MTKYKIKFNTNISCNIAITEFRGTGKFWYFNNGQYGQKEELLEAMEYRLAYHYSKVYVNSCVRHGSEYGATSMSCQRPLTRDGKFSVSEDVLTILKELFQADKDKGIIPENYPFF